MVGVGVGVVEHVHRVAGGRLPGKNLDEAFALDVDNFLVARNPADRVVQEPQEAPWPVSHQVRSMSPAK